MFIHHILKTLSGPIWTGYTSYNEQNCSANIQQRRIRIIFAENKNNPVIIFYFFPEVLSAIAGPTLLSVIDDKEVASDTWTSSLFTPHLRANGSLSSEILDVIGSTVYSELKKQDEVFAALAQYSIFSLPEKVSLKRVIR